MNNNISILVLAAGASSRMGKIKQLMPWKNGTLLSNALDAARDSNASSVTLVTGAYSDQITKRIDGQNIKVLINEEWTTGMGSSIACGMHYLMTSLPACEAVLLMLADQPLIDATYLNELMSAYDKSPYRIIATKYTSGPGVPAIFDNRHFDDLLRLNEAYGARDIITTHKATTITVDPAGKQKDIDTLAEYKQLLEQHSKKL